MAFADRASPIIMHGQIFSPDELAFIQNGQNPLQIPWNNIPSAAASRVVGGMGSHWTCCTPRQHKLERSDLFTDDEWEELYNTAEELFSTNSTSFDDSIRQQLVKHVLGNTVKDREIFSMPLACKRPATNKDYVEWTCTGTILGILADPKYSGDEFEIRPNTQCLRLVVNPSKRDIGFAVVKDILLKKTYAIRANKYVVAAGATLTPGILFNSDLTFPALVCIISWLNHEYSRLIPRRAAI